MKRIINSLGNGLAKMISTPKNFIIYCILLVVGFILSCAVFNDWMGWGYGIEKATNEGFRGYWWKYAIVGLVVTFILGMVAYAIDENKKHGKGF